MKRSRGFALVVAGLLVFSATMAVSAATAPSRDISTSQPSAPASDLPTAEDRPTSATADGTTENGSTAATADGTAGNETTTDETPTATPPSNRVLLGIQGGGERWREHGQIALLSDGEIEWRVSDADSYFDVTRLPDGNIVAGFHHNGYQEGCAPYDSPCSKTGIRIVDLTGAGEPTVETVYTFPVRSTVNSEVHDVEPLGDGRYLFTDMEHERIAVTDGEGIVWQWNASQFYDAPPDPTRVDWLHINDVDVIGEGRYLVSVRNANQVLVIERGEGVVEVINADRGGHDEACTEHRGIADHDGDGDVTCGNPEIVDEQHNPQWLGAGAVLIADSENDRIVELHRNESGQWEPAWALNEAGGLSFRWPRDADRLPNGNTLVTDSLHKRVLEVEPGGDVVWSHGTELIPYEADPYPAGEYPGRSYGAVTATATDSAMPSDPTTETPAATTTATDATGTTTTTATPSSLGTIAPGEDGEVASAGSTVPGLSLLLVGVKAIAPWLPYWFGELQLGLTLVSFGLVVGGGIDRYRD
jgi:hypothetical protein